MRSIELGRFRKGAFIISLSVLPKTCYISVLHIWTEGIVLLFTGCLDRDFVPLDHLIGGKFPIHSSSLLLQCIVPSIMVTINEGNENAVKEELLGKMT